MQKKSSIISIVSEIECGLKNKIYIDIYAKIIIL